MNPTGQDPFTAPDPGQARTRRTYEALFRIAERHAGDETRRRRHTNPYLPDPYEAVALVTGLAAGGVELAPDEEPVDSADLVAALTLVPHLRAEVDALEAGLLRLTRDRGLTWQAIAHGLGLGSAQAARQRFERLTDRVGVAPAVDAPQPAPANRPSDEAGPQDPARQPDDETEPHDLGGRHGDAAAGAGQGDDRSR